MPSASLTFRPENDSDSPFEVRELRLHRESEAGLAFLSSDDFPDLFVAAHEGEDIRFAIDKALKSAFGPEASRVQVYTNGKLDGPDIDVMVKLTR